MKLIAHSFDISTLVLNGLYGSLSIVRGDGAEIALNPTALGASATAQDIADSVATSINAVAAVRNNAKVRAIANNGVLVVLAVEADAFANFTMEMINTGGVRYLPVQDAANWTSYDIEVPYNDPLVGSVSPSAVRTQTIAALIAGTVFGRTTAHN